MLISLVFVLGTMVEFAFVILVNRILQEKDTVLKHANHGADIISSNIHSTGNHLQHKVQSVTNSPEKLWGLKTKIIDKLITYPTFNLFANTRVTSRIDIIAFVVFTFGFLVFNIIYYVAFFHQ